MTHKTNWDVLFDVECNRIAENEILAYREANGVWPERKEIPANIWKNLSPMTQSSIKRMKGN